jgi:hypothetical protein
MRSYLARRKRIRAIAGQSGVSVTSDRCYLDPGMTPHMRLNCRFDRLQLQARRVQRSTCRQELGKFAIDMSEYAMEGAAGVAHRENGKQRRGGQNAAAQPFQGRSAAMLRAPRIARGAPSQQKRCQSCAHGVSTYRVDLARQEMRIEILSMAISRKIASSTSGCFSRKSGRGGRYKRPGALYAAIMCLRRAICVCSRPHLLLLHLRWRLVDRTIAAGSGPHPTG